jgi:hypothetical protein
MTVMSDNVSILGSQFGFTCIVANFLVTVLFLGSYTSMVGKNSIVLNIIYDTIIDDYDYYGQTI